MDHRPSNGSGGGDAGAAGGGGNGGASALGGGGLDSMLGPIPKRKKPPPPPVAAAAASLGAAGGDLRRKSASDVMGHNKKSHASKSGSFVTHHYGGGGSGGGGSLLSSSSESSRRQSFPGASTSLQQDSNISAPIPRKKSRPNNEHQSFASASSSSSQQQLQQHQQQRPSFSSIPTQQQHRSSSSSSLPSTMRKKSPPPSASASSFAAHQQRQEPLLQPPSQPPPRKKNPRIRVKSEDPLILRIRLKGIPMVDIRLQQQQQQQHDYRSSLRQQPSGSRPSYQEPDLTDTDDYMTEDESGRGGPAKKKARLSHYKDPPSSSRSSSVANNAAMSADALATMSGSIVAAALPAGMDEGGAAVTTTATFATVPGPGGIPIIAPLLPTGPVVDAPPEGTLSTLWYSREVFLHVFILEKIVGWKTRPLVQLEALATVDDDEHASAGTFTLEAQEASNLQQQALQREEFWNEPRKRMEVSRINPAKCPVVMALAVAQEEETVKMAAIHNKSNDDNNNNNAPNKAPRFRMHVKQDLEAAKAGTVAREEVLLVKWRGRSHLHCSWERASDIQRLDHSNNTARNKIRRYYQSQELALGPNWKMVLEEDRATAAKLHNLGAAAGAEPAEAADEETTSTDLLGEEYFPIQCLEIERILACDENEMNMQVLATQRAKNIRADQEALALREQETAVKIDDAAVIANMPEEVKATRSLRRMIEDLVKVPGATASETWDPEDNVRYVVKWKGLPYAEMTWEYWRDIKQDAVDQAEDYWYRNTPQLDLLRDTTGQPHPHMRDFKKLQESPVYGISARKRPVASLGDKKDDTAMDESGSEDDGDAFKGFQLRSYQLEGVNWLLFNWWNRRASILADEMGLGKTIQSAAFLQELQNNSSTQVRGPFLIVAPLSLVGQWQSELQAWTPDMNVVLYHGSADARDFLVQQEFYYSDPFVHKSTAVKLKKQHVTKFHILITTYEVVLKDIAVLSKVRWKALIVDEAHRLKNHRARLFEELASVPREHCVLLTGTPIANATEELWALLHFANREAFSDREGFLEKFGNMKDANQVNELHSLLKPYLLRRVKEDVEKSLPPKEETILEVSLTPIQKTYYKAIYERNTAFLYKGAKPSNAPSLMNVMMELRKCCNHPFLARGAEERILAEAAVKAKEKSANEIPDSLHLFGEQLVKSSGKMVLMEKLLRKLFDGGHKVLVFSQMVRMLDLLEEMLRIKKYRYERLDGSTSSSSRLSAVDRFNRKSCQRFVMLLSTRAGGLGLNLTAADIVVIFDSDWNPQNDLQAMARAHRIGQTKSVKIYRLLTAKTYEMHMFHSASLKLGLERAVLSQNREHNDDSDENKKKKSNREAQAKEIDELLKKGAYDVFRDEDDTEAEKFMDTDIDQLLAHSSKKVTYGASATSTLGGSLGSFSKASFVTETADGEKDVDLDDPDFWSKSIGLDVPEETPEEIAAMLDDGVKRSRKQVEVYDPHAEAAQAEQRRKDKIALEKMLEKEERERLRMEKKLKKDAALAKRKREREEQKKEQDAAKQAAAAAAAPVVVVVASAPAKEPKAEPKKVVTESKPKKSKKSDRQRALRRVENENPVLEQLRQAWDRPQRNRASAALIRFGFGRFPKLRTESNLTSLPLQDLEVFARSYLYQLGLQVGVSALEDLRNGFNATLLRSKIQEWLGLGCRQELDWICDSVLSVMKLHMEVESHRRALRMPIILAEPNYVKDLRRGSGFRALRRIGVLARLNQVVTQCLDITLSNLGHEELGKRGCASNVLATLDADLKSRFVTTEELALAIGTTFRKVDSKPPAAWWDRSCDVALVIGTFVHGLSNYKNMKTDESLPFAVKIHSTTQTDEACRAAIQCFRTACQATRKVFDDALEAGRIKAELEVQAAVAAAAKSASQRAEDAAKLREGGEGVEEAIRNMPETQVENAFEFDGTDSHFVTLSRMHKCVHDSLEAGRVVSSSSEEHKSEKGDGNEKGRDELELQMPDARVLDHRLIRVLDAIENDTEREQSFNSDAEVLTHSLWTQSDDVSTNIQVRRDVLSRFLGSDLDDMLSEHSGIGLGSFQCGTTHRTLNDGSDFGYGSASPQLAQIAYGTDAPRFLRALGVPMNVTRFAVSGLVHADADCVQQLLKSDRLKYYGHESSSKDDSQGKSDEAAQHTSQESGGGALPLVQDKEKPSDQEMEQKSGNGDAVPAGEPSAPESTQSTPGPQPKPAVMIDPVELIPEEFRKNGRLRSVVCACVLFYGFPSELATSKSVNPGLLGLLTVGENLFSSTLFDDEKFRSAVVALAPDVEVPDQARLRSYVESILLPHCLRLCVNGNGPTTRNARGSQGEYETGMGVSLHPEPCQPHPSPLPDPCLSMQEHSLEALCQANALLRRVRLLRACQFASSVGSEISPEKIDEVARSKFMGSLQGLPVWWCPWIHDVALLLQAATEGLFSVIPDRSSHGIFSPTSLTGFLRSTVAANNRSLSTIGFTPPYQIDEWIRQQANRFPSINQLERRLAFMSSQITADVSDNHYRYNNLPMFDHGGWPRN